jgi:glycosyltransferase involved in cell wall biosynthesis
MDIKYRAPIFSSTGYSKIARGITKYLTLNGVKVQLVPFEKYRNKMSTDFNYVDLINNRSKSDVMIQHCDPSLIMNFANHYNILLTIFELNGIPKEWVSIVNSRVHELWLPNKFNVNIFGSSGVNHIPHIMPHAIETDIFREKESCFNLKNKKKFVFLSNFQWGGRKGYDTLLEAYTKEFCGHDDVCLVIKIQSNIDENAVKNIITEIRNKWTRGSAPKIFIWWKYIMDEQLPDLYNLADCFVLPSHGEGWGIPYMEAMSCGLPTIATNWSGNLTFMNSKNSFLIKVNKFDHPNIGGWYQKPLKWAIPSVKHLRWLMKYVYTHPREAKRRSIQARRDMVRYWDWNVIIKKYINRLEDLNR